MTIVGTTLLNPAPLNPALCLSAVVPVTSAAMAASSRINAMCASSERRGSSRCGHPVDPRLVVLTECQDAVVAVDTNAVVVAGPDGVEDRQDLVRRDVDLDPVDQEVQQVTPEPSGPLHSHRDVRDGAVRVDRRDGEQQPVLRYAAGVAGDPLPCRPAVDPQHDPPGVGAQQLGAQQLGDDGGPA